MNFDSLADFTAGSPVEPSSDARQLAMVMFDFYSAYVAAGFTEAQAMTIVQTMICANAKGQG